MLEKVSKDKVAKKTKLKAIKQRNLVPHTSKGTIAGKVWETFSAVRKTREPSDIIETALIVGLDHLNVSSCCENLNDSAFYDETDSLSKSDDAGSREVIGVRKRPGLFQNYSYRLRSIENSNYWLISLSVLIINVSLLVFNVR